MMISLLFLWHLAEQARRDRGVVRNGKEYQVFRWLFLTSAENQGWDDKEKFECVERSGKECDDVDRQKHSDI